MYDVGMTTKHEKKGESKMFIRNLKKNQQIKLPTTGEILTVVKVDAFAGIAIIDFTDGTSIGPIPSNTWLEPSDLVGWK